MLTNEQLSTYKQDGLVKSSTHLSEDKVKEILTLKEENQGISQKDFIKKLELENDIKLSVSTLKKMIDDVY